MSDLIDTTWSFLFAFDEQYVALAFSLLGAFVFYLFRLKPKLVFGRAHASLHNLNTADKTKDELDSFLEIYNEQFFVSNEGRKPAHNVSVVLSHFPRNVAITPAQMVAVENVENGRCLITIPYVCARELITLDCIYLNQRAAFVASVRCDESIGKRVDFVAVRKFPNWVYMILWLLVIFGAAFIIQLGLNAVGGI